jgi:hypothetical protein
MMDDDRQARALTERLDRELAGLQLTAPARERFQAGIGAGSPSASPHRHRLRSAIALPLAAAAVVAVVGIPTVLRMSASDTAQPGGGGPQPRVSVPAPVPTSPPSPSASALPLPTVAASATTPTPVAVPTTATGPMTISASPQNPTVGERVTVAVLGSYARGGGAITVTWGDGNSSAPGPAGCPRKALRVLAPVTHTYTRAGRYQVRVVLQRCAAAREEAAVTLGVSAGRPTPAMPTR